MEVFMDVLKRAKVAMENFMTNNVTETEYGLREHFTISILPKPDAFHQQWDDGDGTSRALDSWIFTRLITHDFDTSKDIEEGQYAYFKSLFNKDTGMVCVHDHSYPNKESYYYHMWDQGRALRHLVNRVDLLKDDTKETADAITALINGCLSFSKTQTGKDGEVLRYWETDTFYNGKPLIRGTPGFGTCNYIDFSAVNSQLLEPVVRWAELTGEEKYYSLAKELADGFLAGIEKRRESTSPFFGEDGSFYGHVHCMTSGITGLVHLAMLAHKNGEKQLVKKYADISCKAYEWVLKEDNIVRASSCGWTSENYGSDYPVQSELCCCADMIELASAIALLAETVKDYEKYEHLWEDVDRYTINELFNTQIIHPEKIRNLAGEVKKELDRIEKYYIGAWIFGHAYLHDMTNSLVEESSIGEIIDKKDKGKIRLSVGGCCMYSGVRGFWAYWNAMVKADQNNLYIRFAGRHKNHLADIYEKENGGMKIFALKNFKLTVRIPSFAKEKTLEVLVNGKEKTVKIINNKISLEVLADEQVEISWKNLSWEITEILGPLNNGSIKALEKGERPTYHLKYNGNKLVDVSYMDEAILPYIHGI